MNYSSYFDSWSPIFDDRGLPLVGKIEFCEANTTDYNLKTVYDVDGQPIDNPVYCNVVPSTQIILGEGDYTVRYYKYIGSGNMESDNNETNWHLYKTELLKGADSSTSEVGATEFVDTIAQLKNIEGMANGQKVVVLGYNEAGDCPSRVYTWIANSSVDDDGGIKINSLKDNTGHWRMSVPGTYIDVRWYNDFPDSAAKPTTQTSNLGQRSLAAAAANDLHKDLYFPNTKGRANCYYIFDGSNTVSVTKDIICDNGVRFVVKGGTVGTKVSCHELKKCEKYLFTATAIGDNIGSYAIEANWINSSWFSSKDGEKTASGARVGYVIDYLNSALDFADTKIKIERDGLNKDNVGFRRCEFVDCYKNIDRPAIFQEMEIQQKWFDDDFDMTTCSFNNCTILYDNFYNADDYIKVHNKASFASGDDGYNYGDLNEDKVNNGTIKLSQSYTTILENFNGSITLTGKGSLELHNASVTIYGLNANVNLNLVDCWITIPVESECNSLSLRRGAIISSNVLTSKDSTYICDCDINAQLQLQGATNLIERCEVRKPVATYDLKMYHNKIYNLVNTVPHDYTITFEMIGNTFMNAGAYHKIAGWPNTDGPDGKPVYTVVNGRWENNGALFDDHHWIVIDREYIARSETGHNYFYLNNAQPFFTRNTEHKVWKVWGGKGNYKNHDNLSNLYPMVVLNTYTGEIHLAAAKTNATPFAFYKFSVSGSHYPGSAELIWYFEAGFSELGDRTESQIVPVIKRELSIYNWSYSTYDTIYHYNAGDGRSEYLCAFSLPTTDLTKKESSGSYWSDGQHIGTFPIRWKYGDHQSSGQKIPDLFNYGMSNPQTTEMRVRLHPDITPYTTDDAHHIDY